MWCASCEVMPTYFFNYNFMQSSRVFMVLDFKMVFFYANYSIKTNNLSIDRWWFQDKDIAVEWCWWTLHKYTLKPEVWGQEQIAYRYILFVALATSAFTLAMLAFQMKSTVQESCRKFKKNIDTVQNRTITAFPICPVRQVTEFSICSSNKTTWSGFAMSEESFHIFLFSTVDAHFWSV